MDSLYRSIKFLLKSRAQCLPEVESESILLDTGGRDIAVFCFRRMNLKLPARGTILAIHGMSVTGNRDERLLRICRAMASLGYIVIVPAYGDIEKFIINGKTVNDVSSTIRAVVGSSRLCPTGRIGIFAPSFSAGICLIAASLPATSDLVSALCAVGTFSRVDTAIEYLLGEQENDDYGRMIILKNFIHHSIKDSRRLRRAFEIAIRDNGFRRSDPELPAYAKQLSGRERVIIERLRNDPKYRMRHWKRIERIPEARRILDSLSVVSRLNKLKAAVTLIHGAEDKVIPPSESVLLHEELKRRRVVSRLLLTPLITHGDSRLSLSMLSAVGELVSAFAFFFRNV